MDAPALAVELSQLLDESESSLLAVRVFWKLLPDYSFRGGNKHLASDAQLTLEMLIGLTDYSP